MACQCMDQTEPGMKEKTRTLLRAKNSSSDALRVDGTDRIDVALIFRSLVATTLGTCNASFSGMNAERRGDLGGRGGGWTGSATSCLPVTCDSRGMAAACSDCICGASGCDLYEGAWPVHCC
jgi:hypothetical protein